MSSSERRTQRTMCPMNCQPTLCGMLATVENDRLVAVSGDQDNPDSEGFLCVRGLASREIMDNPQRVLRPLVRDHRGSDDWREVGWDEALDRIVSDMNRIGREAVAFWPCHGAVTNDFGVFANLSLALRFATMYGCQWWDPSMICWGLGGFGVGLTGAFQVNTKEDMSQHSDLIVLWGANLASQPNTARHIATAKRRGAEVVAIDVRISEACRAAHECFIVKPGTDAAMALAMMHVIIDEGLWDAAFVDAHTIGFDALREHVRDLTPAWAATICGIDSGRIAAFARRYAQTERTMLLLGGSSMYKDQNGWQASRAISCLPPLTGKLGKAGAGFGPRHGANPHGHGFGDISNFAARPHGEYVPTEMPAILEAMNDGRIRAMLLVGSDLVSSFADSSRVRAGLEQMELVVCHDLFLNETARGYADVVLPATTWLEGVGVKGTATHLYLMDRILPPAGEAHSMTDLVKDLAGRLGVDGFYPWDRDDGHIDAYLAHPATGYATLAGLRAADGILPLNISPVAHIDQVYDTPSGKIEFYSERAAAGGLPPLPSYAPRPAADFPLELRTGRTINHFHAFYDHGRALPSLVRRDERPLLWLSPGDADRRRIRDGDPVSIHNERGTFRANAKVTERVPAGTVWIHDGWPGLNDLTSGGPTIPSTATRIFPFSAAQSGYDAFVEVSAA